MKKKKEKIIYYDDNSTIMDMSSVNRKGKPQPPREVRPSSTFGEKWRTYWMAVKMMLLPMCVVLLVISILFALLMLIAR